MPKPTPKNASSSLPTKPRGYLGLLYLSLYEERELVRNLARTGLLDKLEAHRVTSSVSANEEPPTTMTLV